MERADEVLLSAALTALEGQSKIVESQSKLVKFIGIICLLIVLSVVGGFVAMHNMTLDKILNADISTEQETTTTSEIVNDNASTMNGNNINIGKVK